MTLGDLIRKANEEELYKAAEEAIKKAFPGDAYYYVGRTGRRLFKEGFKAGSKWAVEQEETDPVEEAYMKGFMDGKKAAEKDFMEMARPRFIKRILCGNDMKNMVDIYSEELPEGKNVVRAIIFKDEKEI